MASSEEPTIRAPKQQGNAYLKDKMKPPSEREFQSAIRVLDLLRQRIDAADAEEGKQCAPETSEQLHARMAKNRVVERLHTIDESVEELRRWQRELNIKEVRGKRHGQSI